MGGRRFNGWMMEIIRFIGLLIQLIIYLFVLALVIRVVIDLMKFIW